MKVFLVILAKWLLVVSYASNHINYHQHCLRESKDFLRHPYDCHKFIRCSHQRAYEFYCPANLLWHHEIKSCDFPYRTQCKLNDQEQSKNVKGSEKLISNEKFSKEFKDKLTKNIENNTDNGEKYGIPKRENAKSGDYVKPTVKCVTENNLTDKISNSTFSYIPEKISNPAEITFKNYPQTTAKNWQNFKTESISGKATDKENKTANSLESFSKKPSNKMSQEEVNSVNLTELMLRNYSTESSLSQKSTVLKEQTNSINLTAATINPAKIVIRNFCLTDNFSVNSTEELKENLILTTPDTASSTSSGPLATEFNLKEYTWPDPLTESLLASSTTESNNNLEEELFSLDIIPLEARLVHLSTLSADETTAGESFNLTEPSESANVMLKKNKTSTNLNAEKSTENLLNIINSSDINSIYSSTETSSHEIPALTEFELPLTADNLTETVLRHDAFTQHLMLHFNGKIQEKDANTLTQLTTTPVTSGIITGNAVDYLSLTDIPDVNLTFFENKNIISRPSESLNTLETSKETDIKYFSINTGLRLLSNNSFSNLTEAVLTAHVRMSKLTGNGILYGKNVITTDKPDIVQVSSTLKETSPIDSAENVKDKKIENNPKPAQTTKPTITLTEHFTKPAIEVSKPLGNLTETFEVRNKNLTNSLSTINKKNQMESSTLHNYSRYDSTTQDPRLPFRSIECQGANNRIKFKANKCYQYYQCFAGWAFLLNCHDGWRFEAKEKKRCILDVNRLCDLE